MTAYADRFQDYSRDCLRIRTRDLRLVPLEFNLIQEVLDAVAAKQISEIGRVRIIVPKRRRGGVSTYVQSRFYHQGTTRSLIQAFTVAHESKSTHNIFKISQLMQEENPLSPGTRYSTRIELDFINRSNLGLATAGSPEAARSSDITLFHGSEMAFWADAETALTAIQACIPDPPAHSEMWLESTGNGFGNLFQKMCFDTYAEGASPYYERDGYPYAYKDPESDWVLVFFPWFCLPDAWREFDTPEQKADFERVLQVPIYREDLGKSGPHPDLEDMKRYGLVAEQINWKRWKIKSEYRGNLEAFTQEYPTTLLDCFRTTGGNVFSNNLCNELEKMCTKVVAEGSLMERHTKVLLRRMENGPFKIWESPEESANYLVTCDPAGGERPHQSNKDDPDYTVIDVWRRDGRFLDQVAQWRGRPDYDVIGDECMLIARYYGMAPIAVLRLNHGLAVLTVLAREKWGGIVKGDDGQPGILEDKHRKRSMVDFLVEAARDGYVRFRSVETVNEMRTFVERNRKQGAEDGCKDDRVASAYAGIYAHEILPVTGGRRKRRGKGGGGKVRFVNAERLGQTKDEPETSGIVRIFT